MALVHSPSIVMDDLVLCLDAANIKSYDKYENLLPYSNDFSNGLWGGYCGNKNSIVYNTTDVISPDGTYNSTKIVKTVNVCSGTSPAFGVIWTEAQQVINKTDTYTASIYVRGAVGGESVVIGLADTRAQTYTLTTSWQRITYTGINDTTDYNTARSFQIAAAGSNVTYYIWGAQVEKGSVANDYYATTTTGKTRGTTWTDLSGFGNNGTITNGPVYSSASGGSLSFDGSDDYVLAGRIPFTGTSTASVSWGVWVYPSSTSGNIMSMTSTNPQGGWNMPPIAATGQKFRGKIWSNNYLYSTTTYTLNTWYYIVLVFDYAAGAQRLYVNGVLQDSQTGITYSSSGIDNYIFLGQSNPGADNTGMFSGRISNFHIYGNKALTASEIQQNFNALRGRFGL